VIQTTEPGGGASAPPFRHVRFATASYSGKPCQKFLDSLAATDDLLRANGWLVSFQMVVGDCYVQHARNELAQQFIESDATDLFYLDDDLGWPAEAALRLLEKPDPLVFGAYPFKRETPGFPVVIRTDALGYPMVRPDGMISATGAPTGFMRIKRSVIERLRAAYPGQKYGGYTIDGKTMPESYDLFPQGVKDGRWWGEDLAFCNLWLGILGDIWCEPNITFDHIGREGRVYRGNYHEFLLAQPRHDEAA
jgi:hypothetical protein